MNFASVLTDSGYFELKQDKFKEINMTIVGSIFRYMSRPIDHHQFTKLAECLLDKVPLILFSFILIYLLLTLQISQKPAAGINPVLEDLLFKFMQYVNL